MANVALLCCDNAQTEEYWHEHNDCEDFECYVEECHNCGQWEALCGMKS